MSYVNWAATNKERKREILRIITSNWGVKTLREISDEVNMPQKEVQKLANWLRKQGVTLPRAKFTKTPTLAPEFMAELQDIANENLKHPVDEL